MKPPAGERAISEEDEALYRQHFLRWDSVRAIAMAAMIAAGDLAFLRNDVELFGGWHRVRGLLAVRLLGAGVALWAIVSIARTKSPRANDRTIALLLGSLVLTTGYIVSTRPPEYLGHGVLNLLVVCSLYFVMPGPLPVRTLGALGMSTVTFWFTLRSSAVAIGLSSMLVAHVFAHVIGIPVARRFDTLRRQLFVAQLEEGRARAARDRQARDLAVAKERAEALARSKSELLTSISHELRTPMNAVLGFSDMLSATKLDAEQSDLVGIIHRSATALLVVLNDLLDTAKAEAGQMRLEDEPFDLRACVLGAADVVRYQAREKGVSIEVEIAPDVPAGLLGDTVRLRQVLVNLLANAVRFTEQGTIEILVSSSGEEDGVHRIALAVRDSGAGIPADVIERLFEPYEQGSADIALRRGGTGLGLSLCKRLVTLMGGDIHVESQVGRGSTFEVRLPVRAAEPPPAVVRGAPVPFVGARSLAILLVDDDALNRRVAASMLQRLGLRADVAVHGREALAALAAREYDVVLMDLRMPEMDGLEATRRIRASPRARRPWIVAMTASAFSEDRDACLEAGMDDFLSKPVRIEDLEAALTRALAASPPPPPAEGVENAVSVENAESSRSAERVESAESTAGAQPAQEDAAILDSEALGKLRKLGPPDFFQSLCDQFVTDSGQCLERCAEAVRSGDAASASRAAHTLKSMAAMIGATRLRALCLDLEKSAAAGDLSGHAEGLASVRLELDRAVRALARETRAPG